MHLQAVRAEWDVIARIPGSQSEEVMDQITDNVAPALFERGEFGDNVMDATGQIVGGETIETHDPRVIGGAVMVIYHACADWPETPDLECEEEDVTACVEAPLLPVAAGQYRFAYMTPPEIAACGGCLRKEASSSRDTIC